MRVGALALPVKNEPREVGLEDRAGLHRHERYAPLPDCRESAQLN